MTAPIPDVADLAPVDLVEVAVDPDVDGLELVACVGLDEDGDA